MRFFAALRLHPIAARLARRLAVDAAVAEIAGLDERWWRRHEGPYHDGGWEALALWSPRGDLFEQRSTGGAFAATTALQSSPGLRSVVDQLPGLRNRVRLMRLLPGARILPHYDPIDTRAQARVRLHVPVVTSPEVDFVIGARRIVMQPGEAWFLDVRFTHAVWNRGTTPRVHLVADLEPDRELEGLLATAEVFGRGSLFKYWAKQRLPYRIRRLIRAEN